MLISISLVACKKADPTPELKDPFYNEFLTQQSDNEKSLAEAKTKLEEMRVEIEGVKPQTGEKKRLEKKYYAQKSLVEKLEQERVFWIVRIKSRKQEARIEYSKAFNQGKDWPDPQIIENYRSEKKLRSERGSWDVSARISRSKTQKVSAGH